MHELFRKLIKLKLQRPKGNLYDHKFDEETQSYNEPIVYLKDDTAASTIFTGLNVELKNIFD